jgi:hypothetical protein
MTESVIISIFIRDYTSGKMSNVGSRLISGLCVEEAITRTTLYISQSVGNNELVVCQAVREYILNTNTQWISNLIIGALNEKFAGFVMGITNNFSDLEYSYYKSTAPKANAIQPSRDSA